MGSSRLRASSWATCVAVILLSIVFALPLLGSVETNETERTLYFDGVDALHEPLERVVLGEQSLVAWLPQGFEQTRRTPTLRIFRNEGSHASIVFSRRKPEPGLGLLHAWELARQGLEEGGLLRSVESVRMIEFAGRPAIEAVARMTVNDDLLTSRIVLSFDPGQEFIRQVTVHCREDYEDLADPLFKLILRDCTPLDQGFWSSDFEVLRSRAQTQVEPPNWWERNRILEAVAQPIAIGQAWVDQQMQNLAQENPVLVLDGLLHHHPRVRIACLKAMSTISGPGDELRIDALVFALNDHDPMVRYEAARQAAADSATTLTVVRRILGIDSAIARSGVFQLFALINDERRTGNIAEIFSERDQYPETSQAMLASMLGEWGGRDADRQLIRAWKMGFGRELRTAAVNELLVRGNESALKYARNVIAKPDEGDILPPGDAVRAVIIGSGANEKDLDDLAERLEEAAETGDGNSEHESWADAAQELRAFSMHLAELPTEATKDQECEVLNEILAEHPGEAWAVWRFIGNSCGREVDEKRVLRVELRQPGSLILALRDLLDRLSMGSDEGNSMYQGTLDSVLEYMSDDFVDGPSARSAGLDLMTPWSWQGWFRGDQPAEASDFDIDLSMNVTCTDPQRFVTLLVRSAGSSIDLEEFLREGVVASPSLPLLPGMLTMIWDSQRESILGEDSVEFSGPWETHMALVRELTPEGGDLWSLRRLEMFRKERPRMQTVFTAYVDGQIVTLNPGPALRNDPLSPEIDANSAEVVMDVDLAALFERGGTEFDDSIRTLIDNAAHVVASFSFDGTDLTTAFSVEGMKEEWFDVFDDRFPGRVRAAGDLLPAQTLVWLGISLDSSRVGAAIRENIDELISDLEDFDSDDLLEFSKMLGSEAGIAVVGMPEPSEDGAKAWANNTVVFIEVDAGKGQRFLHRVMPEKTGRVHHSGSIHAVRAGGFLVFAQAEDVLLKLGTGPMLASTGFFAEILARSPSKASILGGLNVDLFAAEITSLLDPEEDNRMTQTAIGFLRAFGPTVAWCRHHEGVFEGVINLRPNLLTEEARVRARRLVGYVGYTAGSIPVEGFSWLMNDASVEEITLEVEMTGEQWSLCKTPEHSRLQIRETATGKSLITSRIPDALPEVSEVRLPVRDEAMAPYLRSEKGLSLREEEIGKLATEIRNGEEDPAKIIRAIVEWIGENLEYKTIRGTASVKDTLESHEADCSEFTHLTIALCRNLGIPARPVVGAVLQSDMAILHRWAEVYLDRWYEIDPTFGSVQAGASSLRLPVADAYALASIPGGRLRLESVRGLKGELSRRLDEWSSSEAGNRLKLRVSGERVLIGFASKEGEPDRTSMLLVSSNRGDNFQTVAPPAGSTLDELVSGHGRLMWLGKDDSFGSQIFELSPSSALWRELNLPEPLEGLESQDASLALSRVDEGFLALVTDEENRCALLDENLRYIKDLPLPKNLGAGWVMFHDRPWLALIRDDGIELLEWGSGSWTSIVDFSDDEGLRPLRIRHHDSRVEIVCWDEKRERETVLWWSEERAREGRVTPASGLTSCDIVSPDFWVWTICKDNRGLVFHRRMKGQSELQ